MLLHRWSKLVTSYPKVTIIAVLALTVLFAVWIPGLEIDNSIDGMLPADHPARELYDEVDETFGGTDIIIVALESNEVYSESTLRQVLELTRTLEGVEGVNEVISLATANRMEGREGTLVVRDLMAEVPASQADRESLQEYVMSRSLYVNNVVSADGRYASFVIELRADADDAAVYEEIQSIVEAESNSDELFVAGGPAVNAEMTRYMQADLATLTPIVLLVLAVVLYLSLRSAQGVLLPLALVAISVVWTVGLMAWTGTAMAMISTTLPVMLLAIGVADAIHILTEYYDRLRHGEGKREAILVVTQHIGLAIILTSITTSVGFLSLGTSPVSQVMEFGLFVAFGIMAALLVSITLIPAVLALTGIPKTAWATNADSSPRRGLSGRLLSTLGGAVGHHRGKVLAVGGVIFLFMAVGWTQLTVETNTLRFFRPEEPIREATEVVDEHFGGSESLSLVVSGDIKSPSVLNPMLEFQAVSESLPEVGYSVSIADYVAEINEALHMSDSDRRGIPDSRNAVAQLLLLYEMSGDPEDLLRFATSGYDRSRVSLRMESVSSVELGALVDSIRREAQVAGGDEFEVEVTGSAHLFNVLVELLVRGQVLSLGLALLAVGTIIWLVFRSLRFGLLSLIPLGFTIAVNFGLMGWLGIPLDTATTMLASIAIGIGVDYTIHFLAKYRRETAAGKGPQAAVVESTRTTGLAIVYNALAVAGGFAVLLLSSFQPIATLGTLVALTMGVSALAALTLLPSALLLSERSGKEGAAGS
ncbi:MAG: efflux RND transporter permease subunit [Candidatus Bipolaricaulota bacterium]